MSNMQIPDHSELTALRQRVAELEAITAQYEQNQAVLQEHVQRYWVIANFTHSWEYWETAAGTIGYVSPSCARITGYSPDQFIANPALLHDLIVPEDHSLWAEHQHGKKESAGLRTIQFRIRRSDGEIRQIEHTCQPVRDETNIFLGFHVSNQDITEYTQVKNGVDPSHLNNEILEEQQRWEQEMRFRSIIENPLAAVYIVDDDDTIVYVNEEAASIFGYTVDEFIGKSTWQFMDADSRADQQVVKARRQQGESSIIRSQWTGLHKSGEKRIIEAASLSIHNHQGKRQSIGILRDITQQKAAEQQRLELALEKQRGETLRTLISNIFHDIKTPLAAINTSLYLLEKHNDPEKRRQKIANIHTHVQTLESFIQDLLALSRLDGEPELRLTPVDLNELLIEIEAQMRPVLEQKGLTLSLDMVENLVLVQADQSDIRRAFINLTENAIHYTPKGGSVTIRTRTQTQAAIVEITDTGIGIDEDDIPHIFDRFYRTDQAQHIAYTGSGLGLAIVHRVVEMHQGQLEVSSTPGVGSTFRIILPIL